MHWIQRLWIYFAFLHAHGHQHRNHHLSIDRTNKGALFYLKQNLRNSRSSQWASCLRFLRMKEKHQHFLQMMIIWHKITHFHTAKSMWHQNKITNVSNGCINYKLRHILSLIQNVFDTSKSTSTYCWNNVMSNNAPIKKRKRTFYFLYDLKKRKFFGLYVWMHLASFHSAIHS